MSLFRKPTKKIQRRVFCADDDEDGAEDHQPPAPPPPPIISKKEKPAKTPALLSFADEGENIKRVRVETAEIFYYNLDLYTLYIYICLKCFLNLRIILFPKRLN